MMKASLEKVMTRIRNMIRPEVTSETQFGFAVSRGTTNAIITFKAMTVRFI